MNNATIIPNLRRLSLIFFLTLINTPYDCSSFWLSVADVSDLDLVLTLQDKISVTIKINIVKYVLKFAFTQLAISLFFIIELG